MARAQTARWIQLVVAAMAIAVAWLVILPQLGELGPIADHLERLDRHGIEADAMYWTELESSILSPPK